MSDTTVISLTEFLEGDDPDWDTDPAAHAPTDTDQADKWGRKLARLKADADADLELYNTEVARLQLWLSVRQARRDTQTAWLEGSLAEFHRRLIARDPTASTVELPSVTLTARRQQPEWIYTDETEFVAWATTHRPELVRRPDPPPPAPDKNAVKKALAFDATATPGADTPAFDPTSGEIAPGVTVRRRPKKFTATPGAI